MYPKTIRYGTHQYSSCTGSLDPPSTIEEIMIGYFDTTYYAIDF